jgi:hypothetical protein
MTVHKNDILLVALATELFPHSPYSPNIVLLDLFPQTKGLAKDSKICWMASLPTIHFDFALYNLLLTMPHWFKSSLDSQQARKLCMATSRMIQTTMKIVAEICC